MRAGWWLRKFRGMRARHTGVTCTNSTTRGAGSTDSTGISWPIGPRAGPRQEPHVGQKPPARCHRVAHDAVGVHVVDRTEADLALRGRVLGDVGQPGPARVAVASVDQAVPAPVACRAILADLRLPALGGPARAGRGLPQAGGRRWCRASGGAQRSRLDLTTAQLDQQRRNSATDQLTQSAHPRQSITRGTRVGRSAVTCINSTVESAGSTDSP
jgi:hypothetical protein